MGTTDDFIDFVLDVLNTGRIQILPQSTFLYLTVVLYDYRCYDGL